jgi:hypothetical protein
MADDWRNGAWLGEVNQLWLTQREFAAAHKKKKFGETAQRIWQFYGKTYRELIPEQYGDARSMPEEVQSDQKPRINMTRAFVDVMMPFIHDALPERRVSPRVPEMPGELKALLMESGFDASRCGPDVLARIGAWMLTHVLNYTVTEYHLFEESKKVATEALTKGRGVIWHEMIDGSSGRIPASFYDSVDYVDIDPDCRQYRNAAYLYKMCVDSVWNVWQQFKDTVPDPNEIRGKWRTALSQARAATGPQPLELGEKADVCWYYKVWSRMGIGQHLQGASGLTKQIAGKLEELGNNVWLAVMPGMDRPLNLSKELLEVGTVEDLKARVAWPIPFHEEPSNPWPCTFLDFAPNIDDPWATAILEGPLPIQIFIDRLYTFIMNMVPEHSRQLLFVSKAIGEKAMRALIQGLSDEVCPIDGIASEEIKKLIAVWEWPDVKKDLWTMLNDARKVFEDLSGMSPLVLGGQTATQLRSSAEYQGQESHAMSRPRAYAQAMLDWQGRVAAKEAQALRLHCGPATVAPLFGEDPAPFLDPTTGESLDLETFSENQVAQLAQSNPLSCLWNRAVNTKDAREAAGGFLYSCAVGTGRSKNRQKLVEDIKMLTQVVLPEFIGRANAGDVGPFNTYMEMLGDAYELPLEKLKLKPPAPPPGMQGMMSAEAATNA